MSEELSNTNMSDEIVDLLAGANLTLGAGMSSITMALAGMAVANDISKVQVLNAVDKAYDKYIHIQTMGDLQ